MAFLFEMLPPEPCDLPLNSAYSGLAYLPTSFLSDGRAAGFPDVRRLFHPPNITHRGECSRITFDSTAVVGKHRLGVYGLEQISIT